MRKVVPLPRWLRRRLIYYKHNFSSLMLVVRVNVLLINSVQGIEGKPNNSPHKIEVKQKTK